VVVLRAVAGVERKKTERWKEVEDEGKKDISLSFFRPSLVGGKICLFNVSNSCGTL
jgi:hypothetical protein